MILVYTEVKQVKRYPKIWLNKELGLVCFLQRCYCVFCISGRGREDCKSYHKIIIDLILEFDNKITRDNKSTPDCVS